MSAPTRRSKWDQTPDAVAQVATHHDQRTSNGAGGNVNGASESGAAVPMDAAAKAAAFLSSNLGGGVKPAPSGPVGWVPPDMGGNEGQGRPVIYSGELNINACRPEIRYVMTNRDTFDQVNEETGATVITRGTFMHSEGASAEATNPEDKPLHLYVTADSQDKVDRAIHKLKILMERPSTTPSGLLMNKVYIPYASDADPAFGLIGKLIGPKGSFVKHIQQVSGCKVHLRGRGSSYAEGATRQEAPEALHLFITGPTEDQVQQAKTLSEKLIANVKGKYDAFLAEKKAGNFGPGPDYPRDARSPPPPYDSRGPPPPHYDSRGPPPPPSHHEGRGPPPPPGGYDSRPPPPSYDSRGPRGSSPNPYSGSPSPRGHSGSHGPDSTGYRGEQSMHSHSSSSDSQRYDQPRHSDAYPPSSSRQPYDGPGQRYPPRDDRRGAPQDERGPYGQPQRPHPAEPSPSTSQPQSQQGYGYIEWTPEAIAAYYAYYGMPVPPGYQPAPPGPQYPSQDTTAGATTRRFQESSPQQGSSAANLDQAQDMEMEMDSDEDELLVANTRSKRAHEGDDSAHRDSKRPKFDDSDIPPPTSYRQPQPPPPATDKPFWASTSSNRSNVLAPAARSPFDRS